MWNSKGYGGNDQTGGFLNSPSQFSSPAERQDKPARRVQNIVPVTIRQILESPEDGLKIGGADVHMFTLVALVRHVEVTSTRVVYVLDDCTGGISAVFWLESIDSEETQSIPPVVENTYCRVYGSMRTNQNKRSIFVFRIMNLTSLNCLTRHILEVMHSSLKIQKIGTTTYPKELQQSTNNSLSNSFMTTSTNAGPAGFSAQQNLVYSAIMKCSRDIGAHRDEVIKVLEGQMSARDVSNVVDFLSNEGHIYTTIDDDHFRCTDN